MTLFHPRSGHFFCLQQPPISPREFKDPGYHDQATVVYPQLSLVRSQCSQRYVSDLGRTAGLASMLRATYLGMKSELPLCNVSVGHGDDSMETSPS